MKPFLKLCLILPFLGTIPAQAQLEGESLDPELRTNGKTTLQAADPQRKILQKISAVILDGQTPIANGTVMTPDGYILTKTENLTDIKKLSVRVDTKLYDSVAIVGKDPATDLALLKIDANGLSVPSWGDAPPIGSIVIANGATTRTNRRAKLGIISAQTRAIPSSREPAILGIGFAPHEGLSVSTVYPELAAAKAGVKEGDVLLSINGKKVEYPEDIMWLLNGLKAGEPVTLTVKRKGKELKLSSKIIAPPYNRNDMMSGRFNERRDNFPEAIQHDIPLSIYNSGGPLITLDGKTIGINIARANRAESFALTRKIVEKTFLKLNAKERQSR